VTLHNYNAARRKKLHIQGDLLPSEMHKRNPQHHYGHIWPESMHQYASIYPSARSREINTSLQAHNGLVVVSVRISEHVVRSGRDRTWQVNILDNRHLALLNRARHIHTCKLLAQIRRSAQ